MGQCQGSESHFNLDILPDGRVLGIRTTVRMGWKPDLPDFRDRHLAIHAHHKLNLPRKVDLRPKEHFEIYDQGHLGSCTANAIGAAFHFDQIRQGIKDFTPSRLFIYYNERVMEGSVMSDNGASLRDGIKSVHKLGVCPEKLWPYMVGRFTERPAESCYKAAHHHRAKEYARVNQNLEALKACIADGFPFVFGFTVFSSFHTCCVSWTGRMQMPTAHDKPLGGHAVMACGYDDNSEVFIVRNSWGHGWGDSGYFYMPYAYITNPRLAQDFWAIRFVEGARFQSFVP